MNLNYNYDGKAHRQPQHARTGRALVQPEELCREAREVKEAGRKAR